MPKRTLTIGRDYTVSLNRLDRETGKYYWHHLTVRLQIDGQALADQVASRALQSKSHKARRCHGVIVASIVKE